MAANVTRLGELAVAATAVIDRRTQMAAAALANPVELAAPEFTTMVTEKVEATVLSAHAVQGGLPAVTRAAQTWLGRHVAAVGDAATMLWAVGSPVALLALWPRLALASFEANAAAAGEMMHLGVRVFGAGLKPIHRAATRNARRLAQAARADAGATT
jgi:hypothetical protein